MDELEEELPPYILPTVHYEKLLMNDPKRIIYVMERMHMMTTTEMKQELKNLHIDFRFVNVFSSNFVHFSLFDISLFIQNSSFF